jgi:hypothetical protein
MYRPLSLERLVLLGGQQTFLLWQACWADFESWHYWQPKN